MARLLSHKIIKLKMKLLKAWTQGKQHKAIKLQHKILHRTLKEKNQ